MRRGEQASMTDMTNVCLVLAMNVLLRRNDGILEFTAQDLFDDNADDFDLSVQKTDDGGIKVWRSKKVIS